jgi:hypothetical protein
MITAETRAINLRMLYSWHYLFDFFQRAIQCRCGFQRVLPLTTVKENSHLTDSVRHRIIIFIEKRKQPGKQLCRECRNR